ncbi:hypothetical protein BY996DRAFT_6468618 [Phakopsora pachyrhizi]|nr:hypothetical protein BY996DRAFT_6468618 [Phakopsora pachyrhizi]
MIVDGAKAATTRLCELESETERSEAQERSNPAQSSDYKGGPGKYSKIEIFEGYPIEIKKMNKQVYYKVYEDYKLVLKSTRIHQIVGSKLITVIPVNDFVRIRYSDSKAAVLMAFYFAVLKWRVKKDSVRACSVTLKMDLSWPLRISDPASNDTMDSSLLMLLEVDKNSNGQSYPGDSAYNMLLSHRYLLITASLKGKNPHTAIRTAILQGKRIHLPSAPTEKYIVLQLGRNQK